MDHAGFCDDIHWLDVVSTKLEKDQETFEVVQYVMYQPITSDVM